ncbi:TPA: hypothetical protein MD163_002444 [Klebsiella aerogenes]|nr:hypothetical protein [Klebsiella aerogenes]
MKETILYENIWPSDIPSVIEDKIRIDITPSLDFKSFECDYHSIKAVNLREEIAQRQNKESLERIKPLTIGYTGANSALISWGGEKYKSPFIDTYKKPESNRKYKKFKVDLSKVVVKKNVSQEERNEKALWCHIMEKLAPNETRSIDELCEAYKTKEKKYSLTCLIPCVKRNYKKATFKRSAMQYRKSLKTESRPLIVKEPKVKSVKDKPVKVKTIKVKPIKVKKDKSIPRKWREGKYKYVSLIKPGKWRVQAKFKGVSYRRGYFTNYEEACAAADLLALEINQRMGV